MSKQRYITLSEVKDILEGATEYRELTLEQKGALEHANLLAKLSVDDARALCDELETLEFISKVMSCKIADILPTHPDDVRALFAKERINLDKSKIDQIRNIVEKYI